MRKTAIVLIILMAGYLLFGCAKVSKEGFFSYQEGLSGAVCKLHTDSGEYKAELSIKEGKIEKISFLEPAQVNGLTLEKRKTGTALIMGELVYEGSIYMEEMFEMEKLFSLKSEDIKTLEKEGDKSVATGETEGFSWKVVTNKSGLPERLIAEGSLCVEIEIESPKYKDDLKN